MKTEHHEIELTSLSHDGRAVGRLSTDKGTQVVFVENALPGQRARIAITKSKKSFAEATCVEVLQEAPDSITPPCPHAGTCGGCALQSMPAATQIHWKERIVHEAMARIAKLSPEQMECIRPLVPSPQPWGYRNKMEFAFGQDAEGKLVLGLRGKGSHEVHMVEHCMLMPQGCMQVVQQVHALCQDARFKAWAGPEDTLGILRHLVVRRPHTLGPDGKAQLVVNLITAPGGNNARLRLSRLGKELMQQNAAVTGFVLEERRSASMIAQGEHTITQLGPCKLVETLGSVTYTMGHDAFFQINTAAAEVLCQHIQRMAQDVESDGPLCIWDLYCGVGAPGLNLSQHLQQQGQQECQLYGVEINTKAIAMAKRNAEALEFEQVTYVASDAKRALSSWPTPHVVLVDPPRTGLSPEVTQALVKSQAQRIIYVSCNPATLARDMALLSEEYSLKELIPLDFFPQTPHVESCVLLVKK